jgi:purine-binding chemotaxis protein CheW
MPDFGRHVVFRVKADSYALPLSTVREVVVTPELFARVPRAPSAVTGVVNLRGRVVTVLDLACVLGVKEAGPPSAKLLLLDRGRRDLALAVTEVEGIEVLEASSLPSESTGLVRGVARWGERAVQLLDAEALDTRVAGLFRGR